MKAIPVSLGPRSYTLFVGKGEIRRLAREVARIVKGNRPILITTRRTARFCLKRVAREFEKVIPLRTIEIPDGESFKNMRTAEGLYKKLLRMGADRNTPLLILGGGMVGDLAGFVAATYLRGIPYIQLPTTLIAQVDSSVGGKVGVNLPEGKNLVGAFYPPRMVGTDVSFLETLPRRDLVAGLAEVAKYGLIGNQAFYRLLIQKKKEIFARNLETLCEIVVRSVKIKAKITSMDERERLGIRRLLNFGHTFGHALERLTRYRRYRHGEAIAIGMVLAARLSARLGYCPKELPQKIKRDLAGLGLPTEPPPFSKRAWRKAIAVDKKKEYGKIHFVFVKRPGKVVVAPVSPAKLVEAL